jgi:hypothetical protein
MWFTWPSGACGPFVPHPPHAAGRGIRCRSRESVRVDAALLALGHGPRHAATSTGATCGGKNSGRSCGSLAVHCCPPRSWSTSPRSDPRGPSTGPLTCIRTQVRATLLTLAPTFPTRSGPCDPAAMPGFLSWGCPKIAPPSYRIPESAFPEPPRGVSFGMGMPIPTLRAVLVVSHHLDGLFLRNVAALLRAAADPGVHGVSSCRETGFPAVLLAALRSLPSADSCGSDKTNLVRAAGPRHRTDRLRSPRSPRTLPSRPFPLSVAAASSSRRGFPRRAAPCGFPPEALRPHLPGEECGPQGLAPSSGPLLARTFPSARARCSPGLGWFARSRRFPGFCSPSSGSRERV